MVSFDVESLFTNILVNETIDIIQHDNIRFTVECESKDGLPFLDTRVKRSKDLKQKTVLYHNKKLSPERILDRSQI